MIMLYKIKDDYYILVGNKYVKVNFEINGDDINLTSNKDDYIERTPNLKVTEHNFNEDFKKSIINSKRNRRESISTELGNTRFDR